MTHVELKKFDWVVVKGRAAQVVSKVDADRVKVLFKSDKSTAVANISEIETIPPQYPNKEECATEDESSCLNELSTEELELASKRFYMIEKYISGDVTREDIYSALGLSQGTLYKLIKFYDPEVGPISLARKRRGVKGGCRRISEEVEEIIAAAIEKKYEGPASSFSNVWKEVECTCIEKGLEAPSLGTVTARIKSISARELHKRKYGAESARQKFEARPGKLEVDIPLRKAQIDHTLVDVILVDEENREPLGRPWLSVLIDIYTRVILGYYLGFNSPSALSVACAITHAAFPKASFLGRLGLPSEKYPFYGCPKIIHMDNANEFTSRKLIRALSIHNIKPEWRPLGKKHYGGHVERLIGTLMTTEVHFLPGTTLSNPVMRRGYNSERCAALTFKEFSRWFARQVIVYHNTIHSSIKKTPAQAWDEYFTLKDGTIGFPPLVSDPTKFKLDFMPEEMRSIHTWGVTLFNEKYWSPALTPYIGRKKIRIKYDPMTMGTIWADLDGSYIALNFSDVTKNDFSLEERRSEKLSQKKALTIRKGSIQDESTVAIKRQGENIIFKAVSSTKKAKKAAAAKEEYQYYQHAAQNNSANQSSNNHERPDYTKKPKPFSRGT